MSHLLLPGCIILLGAIASAFLWETALRVAIRRGLRKLREEQALRPRALTEREQRAALRVDERDPLWQSLHQILAGMIDEAHGEATDADNQLHPPLPAYYAGAAVHLERLRDFLLAERLKALEEDLTEY